MEDAVLGVLLKKLVIFFQDEAHYVYEFPEQLTKIKDELQLMKSYLNDAEQVKKKDKKETLKMISRKLRELLYDVEDIIADCELMFVKQQRQQASNCMTYFSLSFLIFRYRMGKKLGQINQDIGILRERMTSYLGTTHTLPYQECVARGSQPVRHPILINEDELVGLNDDSSKIMEWILHADVPLTVIGIVGMGGVGKTTLAQKIYNNDDVQKHFDSTLIVVISQNFELKEIIKDILRKLEVKEDLLMRDEIGLLQLLHVHLTGKYLLIMDDIWSTGVLSWWESLKSALPQKNNGSCVIVTTRNEVVARSMGATESHICRPQLLSYDDSWLLFSQIAFARQAGECPNSELERIGKEIVAQCNGLPLAIKVVGGMMLGKELSLFDWKQVSGRLKEELAVHKKGEFVLSTLRLSYEELPMHLKPCMLCFAAFPEDYEIFIENMIYWWIGEGFVQGRDEKTAYEIGEEFLAELVNRGLLLVLDKDYFGRAITWCKVHDMVRDMIIEIAKEENFMSWDDKGSPSLDIQSRRVGIMKTTTNGLFFSELIPKLLRLRTIIWNNIKSRELISKLYQLKWLRVLDLEFTDDLPEENDDWCSGIGSLSHLICLKIRKDRLERLPDSIGNLQNLQVLSLEFCRHLKTLPTQVTSLQKLTNLHIFGCVSLEHYPAGIENLSNLEELGRFRPACSRVTEGCRVSDLGKLTKLRQLRMEIDSEDQIGDEELHVLTQLKELKYLTIDFGFRGRGDEEQKQLFRKVDYDLSPCHQLQELHIWNFPGEETPVWLNPTTLPNLRFLYILFGNIRRMHPGFFGKSSEENKVVWELESLYLNNLYALEEEWPRMQRVMPSLRLVDVVRCPKLKLFPCDMKYEGTWRRVQIKSGLNGAISHQYLPSKQHDA